MTKPLVVFFALSTLPIALAGDPGCPAYPSAQRAADRTIRVRDVALQEFAKTRRIAGVNDAAASAVERRNTIDNYLFDKMASDGVPSAGPSPDGEFLRRVYLDLTGRIPTVDQARTFLDSTAENKRTALIESLLGSEAYVDRWTLFYANMFEITSRYYNYVSVQGRNRFNTYLRDFVARDRSWADVARDLITASGDSHEIGVVNYLTRGIQQGDPTQDTWDTLTDRTTVRFLGMKTECVSCHNGRRHLEEINLFLVERSRQEFWRLSAFFSRTDLSQIQMDAFSRQPRTLVTDRSTGSYTSSVNPNSPGPRPPRTGGPWEPQFILTGEKPANGNWRPELARMITENRQFARAAVNYLWAAMFSKGIVDPPDAWDMRRIDPQNPPPAPWTLQPSNPELIEALADEFIRSGYSIKHMLRLMANSSVYQLSAEHPGPWRPEYERYFARHIARRLGPEEAYDALITATMTETPMYVEGWDSPVMYAHQLPDPSEPRGDFQPRNFLTTLGRGDWWTTPASFTSTVVQVLFLMNDNAVNFRTFATRDGGRTTRVNHILNRKMSDEDAIRELFLATLSRYPTDAEKEAVNRNKRGSRDQWLTDLQWALINKLDFLFTH